MGKVLADLGGRPVVEHVLTRAAGIPGVDLVVLAIPDGADDDPLEKVGHNLSVRVVRGDPTDVLNRYYAAAQLTAADTIVRITADCPLLDPAVSEQVVKRFHAGGADYASNVHPPTFPDGYDTEVISRSALETAWREATDPYEREHVTPFIWRRPSRFHVVNVADREDRSSWRLSIDTPDDLARMRTIWSRLGDRAGLADVVALLASEPHLKRPS
jgi:spore coat polysaccharide biosynthesis protein SpsF (cytidylyltransferase family)